LLEQAALSEEVVAEQDDEEMMNTYETELEWLLVSKATVQTYGLLLNTLLEQTIPVTDDIWYWDEVLGSYTYSSPIHCADITSKILGLVKRYLQ
jgi:nuclear-control-of-ATPase protein 2